MSVLSIVDIAGLVSGASQGEGLGNAFLSHISATDGIFHVVRAFEDPEIVHTELEVGKNKSLFFSFAFRSRQRHENHL